MGGATPIENPPAFAVSPGGITLRHSPIVVQIDPTGAETVDSGVRTGAQASPYDLDFTVVDYDIATYADIANQMIAIEPRAAWKTIIQNQFTVRGVLGGGVGLTGSRVTRNAWQDCCGTLCHQDHLDSVEGKEDAAQQG